MEKAVQITRTPSWEIKLRADFDKLSISERKVAACILADSQYILEWGISDIAHKSDVSDATVVRLCWNRCRTRWISWMTGSWKKRSIPCTRQNISIFLGSAARRRSAAAPSTISAKSACASMSARISTSTIFWRSVSARRLQRGDDDRHLRQPQFADGAHGAYQPHLHLLRPDDAGRPYVRTGRPAGDHRHPFRRRGHADPGRSRKLKRGAGAPSAQLLEPTDGLLLGRDKEKILSMVAFIDKVVQRL